MDECKTSESKYDDEIICSTKKKTSSSILYVIAVISNPARFARRYELFVDFCNRMNCEKYVKLITVELQQGCRDFVTDSTIKLRTDDETRRKSVAIERGDQEAVCSTPDCAREPRWISPRMVSSTKKHNAYESTG